MLYIIYTLIQRSIINIIKLIRSYIVTFKLIRFIHSKWLKYSTLSIIRYTIGIIFIGEFTIIIINTEISETKIRVTRDLDILCIGFNEWDSNYISAEVLRYSSYFNIIRIVIPWNTRINNRSCSICRKPNLLISAIPSNFNVINLINSVEFKYYPSWWLSTNSYYILIIILLTLPLDNRGSFKSVSLSVPTILSLKE